MKDVTARELKEMMDHQVRLTFVDVREPYEHEEYNIGGILIPLSEIPSSAERLKEFADTEIVLYCRSGNRSLMAQKMLAMQGITNTINLRGGVIAWRESQERDA